MAKPRPPRSEAPTKPPTGDASPHASPRTATLPEGHRGAFFAGPDDVTALSIYATGRAFELARNGKTLTVGASPECDVSIPGDYLSTIHCLVERRSGALRVRDQGSKNGTFYRSRREDVFDVRPGETFTCASMRFLALNDEMRAAYPTLVEIVGGEDERALASLDVSPNDLVIAAAHGSNILLTGEPGCDQARLARTLHAMSLRRDRPIVEIDQVPDTRERQRAVLDRASRSTLVFTVEPHHALADATFVSALLSPSYHIRLIVIAPTDTVAGKVLGAPTIRQMQHVWVRPLSTRQNSIRALLDRMLREEEAAPFGAADLTAANQAALRRYPWPDNLPGLRLAAKRLVAIARAGSLRKAAEVLGMSKSALHYWFTQLERRSVSSLSEIDRLAGPDRQRDPIVIGSAHDGHQTLEPERDR